MKRKVFREVLAIGIILLSLEGAYRLYKFWRYGIADYPDAIAVGYFEPHPRYGTVPKKSFSSKSVPAKIRRDPALKIFFGSTYTTNSLGFRGPEVSIPKPPGTYRIVVIGESTSLNMEMDDGETWPAQLEKRLNGDIGFLRSRNAERVEVVNASGGGWRVREGLIRLREEIPSLEPDMVLASLNWNDGNAGAEGMDPGQSLSSRKPWWRHVKITENIWIRLTGLESADPGHQQRLRKELRFDKPWARACVRNLTEMDAAAREMGAEMVLVDLPGLCRFGVEEGSEEFRAVVERTRVTAANYPFWAELKGVMSGLFREVSRRQGVPVADAGKHFDLFTGPARVDLFTDEMHVNRRGAAEVAEAVHLALASPASSRGPGSAPRQRSASLPR